jgi:hypothetical protein
MRLSISFNLEKLGFLLIRNKVGYNFNSLLKSSEKIITKLNSETEKETTTSLNQVSIIEKKNETEGTLTAMFTADKTLDVKRNSKD